VSERGSILPLVAGAVALGLVMIFGVTSATSLLIERARLYSLADASATAAAEAFNPAGVSLTARGIRAPLSAQDVDRSVRSYLLLAGGGSLRSVVIERATTPDGVVAEVTLSSLWSPPVVSDFFPSSVRLFVTATSQVFIR
jgi:hypothetical protein